MQLLLSETKLLNDSSVSLDVYLLEVVEEVSSVTYHLEETAAAVVDTIARQGMERTRSGL